jgi:hypothetical protein
MKQLIIAIMLLSCVNLFGQVKDFNDIPKDILVVLLLINLKLEPIDMQLEALIPLLKFG